MNPEQQEDLRLKEQLRQLKQQLRLAEQELRLLTKQRTEPELRLAERRDRQDELKDRLVERRYRLAHGSYFSPLEEVWTKSSRRWIYRENVSFFTALRRNRAPDFLERGQTQLGNHGNAYLTSIREAKQQGAIPADETKLSHSTPNTFKRDTIWPTDIFGKGGRVAGIAHLVPTGTTKASMYADVARCVFGVEDVDCDNKDLKKVDAMLLQKLIHGSKLPPGSRKDHTGLKHLIANMIRLRQQKYVLDAYPCVFILPIYAMKQIREWNGHGYSAIVLATGHDEDGITVDDVYSSLETNRTAPFDLATPREIELACEVLKSFLLGMGYSLLFRKRKIMQGLTRQATLSELKALRRKFGKGAVRLPIIFPGKNFGIVRVRRVTFHNHINPSVPNGHPAPDPMLLGFKAAINWSRIHNQQLLAVADPLDEDDNNTEAEGDRLAQEEYLMWREQCRLEHQDKVLCGMNVGVSVESHHDDNDVVSDLDEMEEESRSIY